MELTIRDWMVIAGVLLIFAVLLDAVRRVRRDRSSSVQVKLASQEQNSLPQEADISWLKEFPNGGARVVERGDLLKATQKNRALKASTKDNGASSGADISKHQSEADEVELVSGISASDDPENIDWLDTPDNSENVDVEQPRLPRQLDPEVFMLNVIAREPSGFRGEDILHILLACDLRFGDMSFFHRHEQEAGRGPIQFSVANMMRPGVFDIDNMSDMETPGLVFFLTLPGPEDMMQAFDYMLETAQAVARNLKGDVLDESRSVMTRQTLEHSRQKIRDLERRMLTQAAS